MVAKKQSVSAIANDTLKVEWLSIETIKPYLNNPRTNESAVDGVLNSLREFGWQQPIVVDDKNVIIAGHTRWKAALRLNLQKVPVIIAAHLTEEQVRAYRLADNASASVATWNYPLLQEELTELGEWNLEDFGLSPSVYDFMEPMGMEISAGTASAARALDDSDDDSVAFGDDDRAGRFILVYTTEEEKAYWCNQLNIPIESDQVVFLVKNEDARLDKLEQDA